MNIPITYSTINRPTTLVCELERAPVRHGDAIECERVAREVSQTFGVSVVELRGKSRKFHVSHPRQVAQFLMSEMGQHSAYLSAYFDCDESNLRHNKTAVVDRASVDAKFRLQVEQLRRRLEAA